MRATSGIPRLVSTVLCAAVLAGAATVTIDKSKTYQTIDGLGAFIAIADVTVKDGPFYVSKPIEPQYDTIAHHLGASMMRFEIPPTFLPEEGAEYDPNGSVFGTHTVRKTFRHCRELVARGCERFIGTVWSPPCWMKYTKQCNQGGVMDPKWYDRYAQFITDYCKMFKDSVGVELYAVSYANEPQFSQPYNSCIWGDDALNAIITKGGASLKAAGLSTRIFAAEHMFWAKIGPYNKVSSNPNLYAFAVHGYSDGVSADYGTASDWESFASTLKGKGKKVWMTETTCNSSVINTAKTLHTAFKSGRVSAWTWWAYKDNLCDGSDQPKDCFYGSKHYFRFVRPGARMVDANSSQSGLWVTAFTHAADNTTTIVLINNGGGTSVQLSGSGLPGTFTKWESAGGAKVVNKGEVSGSGSISIAGGSVTTLYSGEVTVSTARPARVQPGGAPAMQTALTVKVFDLDGRQVRKLPSVFVGEPHAVRLAAMRSGLALGTYVAVAGNGRGKQWRSVFRIDEVQ